MYLCKNIGMEIKTKAKKTKQYILEKVSPIFNKNGYSGTSLSDITKATGLTKGAIYGNFTNKEELALEAFNYNIRFVIFKIRDIIVTIDSPVSQLFALTNFYRTYYLQDTNIGGCPILNVGIDANHTNPKLFKQVKNVMVKLKDSVSKIIEEGKQKGEIKKSIDSEIYGGRIFSLIEGSIFTSVMLKDDKYVKDMMNHLDEMIKNEMIK